MRLFSDMHPSINPCDFCGSTRRRVIHRQRVECTLIDMASVSSNARGTQTVYECDECRLRFADVSNLSWEAIQNVLRTADVTDYLSQDLYRKKTYRKATQNFAPLFQESGRAFDVGAGSGAFLSVLQEQGWEVSGCEVNEKLCAVAAQKGIHLEPQTLSALTLPNDSFDVITFWDSLEHTLDPHAQLRSAAHALRPGGHILVNYPNVNTWFARVLRDRWWYCIPMHFYYFSLSTLTNKLRALGLTPTLHRRHWQSLELGHVLAQAGFGSIPVRWPLSYYAGQWTLIAKKTSTFIARQSTGLARNDSVRR